MNKSTYNKISKIPIIGSIVSGILIDPTMYSSAFINSDAFKKVLDYSEKHPDILITKKILEEILSNN